MDRTTFIQQYGRIKRVAQIEQLVVPLRHPAPVGDPAAPLFPGHFYTTGYGLPTVDPQREDQPWAALADARQRTTKWVRKLRAGGCGALQSDRPYPYVPFICQLAAPVAGPGIADQLVAALGLAAVGYDVRLADAPPWVFWPAADTPGYAEELPEPMLVHYAQVSAWMTAALTTLIEIRLAPTALEFPVIYGGLRPAGLFVGVMTVWHWG
ncbi:MAG TPA: hypothetical protein VGE07_15125 [Herpetosiphonaceae bacterium]